MTINFEQLLDQEQQSALADEIVTGATAVMSAASAPDFVVQSLAQGVSASLAPDQRDAAIALQAYAVKCTGEVLSAALDPSAAEAVRQLGTALENQSPDGALTILDQQPESAEAFKSHMCFAIAGKCAELAAADIDRLKKGKITILDEADQRIFEQRHEQREQQQATAATAFLSSLPGRYPSFGTTLFKAIRHDVQHDIEEKYKSPDIHARVASLFRDALEAMPPEVRADAK